ncbi:MAG: ribonuclease P protein component [Bacteroidales bacterium]|nr:ribonuclease P protein component [Bacteroidales bacterium]
MDKNNFTFSKKEKLCSRKVISLLFENGRSFYSEPFRILWMKSDNELPFPAQTVISAGKRTFPRAVTRNRIKRLVREVWRLNKNELYRQLQQMNTQVYIMIIYTGTKVPDYEKLETQMKDLVVKFSLYLASTMKNN